MRIEELDRGDTPWGVISLRQRWDPITERDVHEVKLGDDFLMSSQFTTGEEELARIGLAAVTGDVPDGPGGWARARLHGAGRPRG